MTQFLATFNKPWGKEGNNTRYLKVVDKKKKDIGYYKQYFDVDELLYFLTKNIDQQSDEFKQPFYLDQDHNLTTDNFGDTIGFIQKNNQSDYYFICIFETDEANDLKEEDFVFDKYFFNIDQLNKYLSQNKNIELIDQIISAKFITAKLVFHK